VLKKYHIPKKLSDRLNYHLKPLKSENKTALICYYSELIILFLSALFTVLLLPLLRTPLPELPFELSSVLSVDGVLSSDSRQIGTDRYIYSVRISSAVSKAGIRADSKGLVKIISGGGFFYRGSHIRADNPVFKLYNVKKPLYFQSPPLISASLVALKNKSKMIQAREKTVKYILSAIKKIDTGDGLAAALLLGDRKNLNLVLSENIRKSGCSHILALSGMHLGILTMFIFFILKKAAGIRFSIIAAVLFNFLFALTAGMSAALLRAFIFFTLTAAARLAGRKADLKKLLVLCFIITVFAAPDEAGELSFQYSFIAVTGIIFFTGHIMKNAGSFIPLFAAAPLACTISAQLPSWILSTVVFNEIFFSGLAASLVLTPLVTLFMLTAFPHLIFVVSTGFPIAYLSLFMKAVSSAIHFSAAFFSALPSFKTGLLSLHLLIILNLFVIFSSMFPCRHIKRFK